MLLIPLVLSIVGLIELPLTGGMSQWSGRPYHSPLTVLAGPIPIHFASIADFAGILAIVLIVFVRFLRVQRDQERVSSELAAARSVQELMIPQEKLNTPGFEVDSWSATVPPVRSAATSSTSSPLKTAACSSSSAM